MLCSLAMYAAWPSACPVSAEASAAFPNPDAGRLPAVLEVVAHSCPRRPQRVVHVMPSGYSQHPSITVHTKIISLMKASGVCVRS